MAGKRTRSWVRSRSVTEEEWLACNDPRPMLEFLKGKASDRQLRLFACACCRHRWDDLTFGRFRRAVEAAERFADGLAGEAELDRAHSMAVDAQSAYLRPTWPPPIAVHGRAELGCRTGHGAGRPVGPPGARSAIPCGQARRDRSCPGPGRGRGGIPPVHRRPTPVPCRLGRSPLADHGRSRSRPGGV